MPEGERRLLEPGELWPQEQALCAKAAEGLLLDLRCRQPGEDDPIQGRKWGAHRRIRAQVLFQLLTGHGPKLADPAVAVRVRGAQIVGRLNLGGWKLRCPLELNQCHLHHPLDLAKAEVRNLSLRGSNLRAGLSARQLQVIHTLNLSSGFRCDRRAVLRGAHISGQLVAFEAVFANPAGEALSADRLTVDHDLFLTKAQCTGQVRLAGAHISGQLDAFEAVFANPAGEAVILVQAVVSKEVFMLPASLTGELNLTSARVGSWYDKKRTWPTQLNLDGFVYDRIEASDATVEDRLRSWLPKKNYVPQPYEQLAAVYRREGHEQAARTVAIGKQRARRADHSRWWRRWPSVAWSAVLRWSIGYGYRPALALIPLAVLVAAGSVLFLLASQDPGLLRPAKTGAEQPGFNSFRYTMDLLLPVATFKQRDAFVTGGWAAWAAFGFTFAGWLLAAIVVAGLSGVFKRN